MKNIFIAIKSFIIFSILLGLVYPLAITGIAQVVFPQKANGSLIIENGKVIGSSLIGQKFDSPTYFNSRPSAVDYNAAGSGASNLGPSSKKLMERVKEANEKWEMVNGKRGTVNGLIPADAVLASTSGLDPHISIENAKLQAKRIAQIRGLQISKLDELISNNTDSEFLGIWGQEGVNVLKLNLDLDKVNKQ